MTSALHTPTLMIQGTGSHVGKSVIVAGLCRALSHRGLRVAPFKPQNMSNNAAVAADGGEIGRAQALQARAAGLTPSVHMNPVLLKPETDRGAQVIVQGRPWGRLRAADYGERKQALMPAVLDSFGRIAADADIVLVEGAGSPAEINLRVGDIANMGFAAATRIPVILLGDIDRGGVIASLVGTHAVLASADRGRIKGFLINKFRGDASLFRDGLKAVTDVTGWPSFGVIPWFSAARHLPAEDVLGLVNDSGPVGNDQVTIAVPALPRIANFDDLDPLRLEPGVSIVIVQPGEPIPSNATVVMIPGSKATIADLTFIREQGWDIDIHAHYRRGGHVLGLCGGYQMLGRTIRDPQGIEGAAGDVEGLGLLDVDTVLTADKSTVAVRGRSLRNSTSVAGYEIHIGRTTGPDCDRPVFELNGRVDGACSADGLVVGSYVHGMFGADGFRRAYLADLGASPSEVRYEHIVDKTLDQLADHLEKHVDVDEFLKIAAESGGRTRPG
ncbi:MAG: cobyric acid synthase [Hyphomicrobiales bacterium]|nr:cobyric acid synthase [Hyphomicrobiales bacterium]